MLLPYCSLHALLFSPSTRCPSAELMTVCDLFSSFVRTNHHMFQHVYTSIGRWVCWQTKKETKRELDLACPPAVNIGSELLAKNIHQA